MSDNNLLELKHVTGSKFKRTYRICLLLYAQISVNVHITLEKEPKPMNTILATTRDAPYATIKKREPRLVLLYIEAFVMTNNDTTKLWT